MFMVLGLKDAEARLCELRTPRRRSLGLRAQLLAEASPCLLWPEGGKAPGIQPVTQPALPSLSLHQPPFIISFYWDGFFGSLIIGILALFAGL